MSKTTPGELGPFDPVEAQGVIWSLEAVVAIKEQRIADLEKRLERLQDAISPSRKGMVGDDYYLGVVERMRGREAAIKPMNEVSA